MSIYPPESTLVLSLDIRISQHCVGESIWRTSIARIQRGKGDLSAKVSTRDDGGNCRRKRSPEFPIYECPRSVEGQLFGNMERNLSVLRRHLDIYKIDEIPF